MSFAALNIDINARFAKFEEELNRSRKSIDSFGKDINGAFTSVKNTLAGLAGGISVSALFKESIEAAIQAEQASARLDAVLQATGHSAGITRKELDGMADAMAKSTQFDDESIRNASAELLKFGNIQGDVFRESLKLSADVAAFLGEDITSAAAKLGKSLVEPETAFGLLKRAGVALTEQQKDQIKAFEESGQKAKAQEVIIKALEKAFGGAAEKLNTGLLKSTKDVGKAWDEMLESFGKTSVVSGGTNFVLEQTSILLTDMKTLVEEGDWIDKLRFLTTFDPNYRMPSVSDRQSSGRIGGRSASPEQLGAQNQHLRELEDAEYTRRKEACSKSGGTWDVKAGKCIPKAHERSFFFQDELRRMDAEAGGEQKGRAAAAKDVEDLKRKYLDLADPVQKYRVQLEEIDTLRQKFPEQSAAWMEAEMNVQEEINATFDDVKDATKETSDFARDMGMSFSSAFENAIVDGENFSDMLKGLEKDIARIIIRKSVTEPLGNAVSTAVTNSNMGSWFSNLLPSFDVGTDFVPHDMVAKIHKGERILTAAENRAGGIGIGGTTNHFSVDMRGASVEAVQRLEAFVMQINGTLERRAITAVSQSRVRGLS